MLASDATFTNGRWVLPPHARGVLVLADPPEAGWRIEESSDEAAVYKVEPLCALGRDRDDETP